jgi:hypothetical protein
LVGDNADTHEPKHKYKWSIGMIGGLTFTPEGFIICCFILFFLKVFPLCKLKVLHGILH